MDNKKNLYVYIYIYIYIYIEIKKKSTYPDNKKNLWTNHKSGVSKNKNNKSIINPSKKITKPK